MPLIPPGKRKGNRFFLYRTQINGREFEVSTRTTNKKIAREFADKFRARVLEGDIARSRTIPTFADAIDMYLASRETSRSHARYLDKMRPVLGSRPITGDNRVRQADIHAAALTLYPKAMAATRNRQVVAMAAAVLHHAAENELCEYQVIKRFKETRPETRVPTDEAVITLLEHATGDLGLLMLFETYQGWRITESLQLRWIADGKNPHVELSTQELVLYSSKADAWKRVPMHPIVFEALANVDDKSGKVFRWHTRSGVYKHLWRLCEAHNIKVTPHMLRHWFATKLAEQRSSNLDIKAAGSWFSEKSVERYTNANAEHAQNVINRLDRVESRGVSRGKIAK